MDILQKAYPPEILSSCLQRFVSEAKRTDGTSYPPKTLYQMLCGLLRYTKECQPDPPNFLDRNDARFKKLRGTCDTVFRGLHEAGVGVQKKSAQVFTRDDEDKFWDTGTFNTASPQGLQNAVYFFMWARCAACVED